MALASAGASVTVSSLFPGSTLHRREHLNDGRYGNERSWISNERGRGWVAVDFGRERQICRVVWGRDRQGHYRDRLPVDYVIEAESAPGKWTTIGGPSGQLERGAEKGRAVELFAALSRVKGERRKLEADSMVYAAQFEEPAAVHRLFRGDPGSPARRWRRAALPSWVRSTSRPPRRKKCGGWRWPNGSYDRRIR